MAERIPAPTDIAKTNWNSDGITYPSTDPGSGKRATGYKPKDVPTSPSDGEIITANEQNYLHGLEMQMHTWLKQFIPREWTELSEGITASSVVRQLFRVVPPNTGIRSRLVTVWTTTSVATGTLNPKSICTDGEQTYYIAGTGNKYIVAVSPVDGSDGAGGGSPIWEINPHATVDVTALTCDGNYVYYVLSGTVTGLQRVDRDGTNLTTAGVTLAHNKMRANGGWVVGIAGSTGAGDLDIWVVSTMTLVATKATGSAGLTGVAMDEDVVYVGGARNAGNDMWAYTLVTGAAVWSAPLDTNVFLIRDMCADGDFVYVVTDDAVLAAGGNASLFCLNRLSGAVFWTMDIGVNLNHVAVDDEYIYALADSSNELYMIRRGQNGSPAPGVVKVKSSVAVATNDILAVDGVSVYARPSGTTTDLIRISNGGVTKTFMRAAGSDTRRRPFYTLAVPTTGRT
jgi:hypothetical protein